MITRAEVDDFLTRDPATMDTRARLVRQLFDLYTPDEPAKAAPRGGRPSEARAFDYTDPSWREFAACRDADPDLFFVDRGASTRRAKAICAECTVVEECLEYALRTPGCGYGIWGGLAERERRKVRRARGIRELDPINHGTPSGYRQHLRRAIDPCRACREANAVAKR